MSVVKARDYWIGCDLDGTLAEHYWPHRLPFDPYIIGAPIPPMAAQIKWHLARGEKVVIFTARVGPKPPDYPVDFALIRNAIRTWTLEHLGQALEATHEKDYRMAFLYDDRAIGVEHNTGRIIIDACNDDIDVHVFPHTCEPPVALPG